MIEKYLNTITKSQDKLDGHAICPYANKFKENILICETDDMKKMVEYYTINFPADKKVVVIISKPEKYDYETLTNYCSIYQSDKLWLAPDHPKHYNEIGGIKTNNEDFAMILIQDREELNRYSNILKKTSYYSFWTKEYFAEIVTDR